MTNEKKILFFIPALGIGGAERQMLLLLKFLKEKGINPIVLTYNDPALDYNIDFEINRIIVRSNNVISRYYKLMKTLIKQKPDIILSYLRIPNILTIFYSIIFPKTHIVVSQRSTPSKKTILNKLIFSLYKKSNVIVANSHSSADYLINNHPSLSSKVKIITNYTDLDTFVFNHKPIGKIMKIGVFARYISTKNTYRFIEAVKILNAKYSNVEYHWYGQKFLDKNGLPTKRSSYYLRCEELKEKYKLDNLTFHSFAPNVIKEIQDVDAVCLPSLVEGFSNVLSESICCGKPVIASNIADNALFVDEGKNGFLFNPYDINDMVSAIEKFLSLKENELFGFQKNSRRKAEVLFSKDVFVDSYIRILMRCNDKS